MSIYVVKSRINQAREQIQSERIDGLENVLAGAEGSLATLTDIDKGPILAEIAALRMAAAAMVQPEEKLKLSGARGKIRQAKEYLDKGYDPADTAKLVAMVEEFLVHVRDPHKAKELDELAAIKARLAPAAAPAPVAAVGTAPVTAPAAAPMTAAAPAPTSSTPAAAAPSATPGRSPTRARSVRPAISTRATPPAGSRRGASACATSRAPASRASAGWPRWATPTAGPRRSPRRSPS
jgi:hypothetical protein